jgi:hypothetical protein
MIRDDRKQNEQIEDALRNLRTLLVPNEREVEAALKSLFTWTPEIASPKFFNAQRPFVGDGMYTIAEHQCKQKKGLERREICEQADCQLGSEDMPFFTEGFLYPLIGKEDARSLIARMHTLLEAMGYDRLTQHDRFGI